MPPACSACKHWGPETRAVDGRRPCLASPPSMGREVQVVGSPWPVVFAAWPLTKHDHYCGRFEVPAPAPPLAAAPVVEPPDPPAEKKPRRKGE